MSSSNFINDLFHSGGDFSSRRPVVDLWLIADDRSLEIPVHSLSSSERERADRYRSTQKRRQFLFSRSVGREIFAAYLNCSPDEIDWNASGPPIVRRIDHQAEDSRISVSLSHSGNVVAIAIAGADYGIGVDIESTETPLKVAPIAAVSLTESEHEYLDSFPVSQQSSVMRLLWTRKEAAIKSLRKANPPDVRSIEIAASISSSGKHAWSASARSVSAQEGRTFEFSIGSFGARWRPEALPVWSFSDDGIDDSDFYGSLAIHLGEKLKTSVQENASCGRIQFTNANVPLCCDAGVLRYCGVMRASLMGE